MKVMNYLFPLLLAGVVPAGAQTTVKKTPAKANTTTQVVTQAQQGDKFTKENFDIVFVSTVPREKWVSSSDDGNMIDLNNDNIPDMSLFSFVKQVIEAGEAKNKRKWPVKVHPQLMTPEELKNYVTTHGLDVCPEQFFVLGSGENDNLFRIKKLVGAVKELSRLENDLTWALEYLKQDAQNDSLAIIQIQKELERTRRKKKKREKETLLQGHQKNFDANKIAIISGEKALAHQDSFLLANGVKGIPLEQLLPLAKDTIPANDLPTLKNLLPPEDKEILKAIEITRANYIVGAILEGKPSVFDNNQTFNPLILANGIQHTYPNPFIQGTVSGSSSPGNPFMPSTKGNTITVTGGPYNTKITATKGTATEPIGSITYNIYQAYDWLNIIKDYINGGNKRQK